MYDAGSTCKAHGVPGFVDQSDGYQCEGNVRGVQHVLEGDVRGPFAIGDTYRQVASSNCPKGLLVGSIDGLRHDHLVVDHVLL